MITRIIPSSKEPLPVAGIGTWKTFDVPDDDPSEELTEVLTIMKNAGASLIDSSPMYGNAEKTIGRLTADPSLHDHFFYATKVWTSGKQQGIEQMESSFQKMGRTSMDLVQIHNLVDWETHLQTLNEWKAEGKIRYTGITHYTDELHEELEKIIRTQVIDFVQFNYSIFSRNAEISLLKLAADRGVATIINRPFGKGNAFGWVKGKHLPPWAREYGISNWSQFFLSYIIAHPAVTVVIPATGDPEHAKENYDLPSVLPDEAVRKKMAAFVQGL
jgi:diketogulonate reductase-like aldo/keto reductase